MEKIIWQIPFHQSNLNTNDWVHYKAKHHAYADSKVSLCGKHYLSTYHNKQTLKELSEEVGDYRNYVCKTCLNKINKMIEKEEREKTRYQLVIEASSFEEACALQLQIEEFEIFGKINIIKGKVGK